VTKIEATENLPANLVAIEDKAFANFFLNGLGGPDSLDEAALLLTRSDLDL